MRDNQLVGYGLVWAGWWLRQRASEVPVEVWPYGRPGSGTATTTQPKVTGTVTVREPDGELLGGEADKSVGACTALPPVHQQLQTALQQQFDPKGVFATGRLHAFTL